MEILKLKNNHLKKPKDIEYGCECSRCGTVFTFHRSEARPRHIVLIPNNCTIKCPNCKHIMSLDKCYEFTDENDKKNFLKLYDIEEDK